MRQHKKHKRRRSMRRRTLTLVVIPAVVGASLVGGFAAAVFTMSGSVQADGHVATPTSPTATAHIAALWPGECSDVIVTFANDNEHAVVIDAISGSITQQPDSGDRGHHLVHGDNSDPVVWRADSDALAGRVVTASGSATFTISDAVCLSAAAGAEVEGDDVAASITFGFHVPAGTDYRG